MTPWTVARQAPQSMGFPRQECWSRLPFPLPGDLPDPGIKPVSPALQADSLPLSHLGIPVRPLVLIKFRLKVWTKIHHSFYQGAHTVSSLLKPLLIFREIICRLKKLSLKGNSAVGNRDPFWAKSVVEGLGFILACFIIAPWLFSSQRIFLFNNNAVLSLI